MNFRHSTITLIATLTISENFCQVSAKAQANHCDEIGFGRAPCLDNNNPSNAFTQFMHNECVHGESPTFCDQYNPGWGQVHFTYKNKYDTGCDLSNCEDLLYVHPVFDTFVEGKRKDHIKSFTHCTQGECLLPDNDVDAANKCWTTFSTCFPNKIDQYHVMVEQGTDFDNESKLKEYYIYTSLPFAGSKAKDPKCDACKDCYEKCEEAINEDDSNLADLPLTNDVSSSHTVVSSCYVSFLIVFATAAENIMFL